MKSVLWVTLILAVFTVPAWAAKESADSWNERGLAYKEAGRHDEAIEAFTRALALEPGHLEAMNNLGREYFVTGRYREAAARFEEVLSHTPHAVGTMKNLAAAYARLGRYGDAATVLGRAVSSAPGDAQARLELGIVSLLAGDRAAAERQYETLRDVDPVRAGQLRTILDREK